MASPLAVVCEGDVVVVDAGDGERLLDQALVESSHNFAILFHEMGGCRASRAASEAVAEHSTSKDVNALTGSEKAHHKSASTEGSEPGHAGLGTDLCSQLPELLLTKLVRVVIQQFGVEVHFIN